MYSLVRSWNSSFGCTGAKNGKLEGLQFHVYALNGNTPLTKRPISLRKPSSGGSVTHTCQMEAGSKENQAFAAILRKFETDHPNMKPFNKSRFTLEEDVGGRWVHRPGSSKTKSSVSDHFRFELVSKFTGVRPTSSPPAL
jgi:hypothetical protein